VTREGGDKADFWSSWVDRAESGNRSAQTLVHRYQYRPAEELYDVVQDPHCLNNLIAEPQHSETIRELSQELDQWMQSQGDQGAETEALANTRSNSFIKKHGNK
jgi:uncharacterized sulfatase